MRTNAENRQLPKFYERFHELRGNMTQSDFAKKTGLSRPTIGFYENGERLPDAYKLKQIAEKCGVSADWLLGMTDVRTTDVNLQAIYKRTGLTDEHLDAVESMQNAKKNPVKPSIEEELSINEFNWLCTYNAHTMLTLLLSLCRHGNGKDGLAPVAVQMLARLLDYVNAKETVFSKIPLARELQLIALDLHILIYELRKNIQEVNQCHVKST